MSGSVFSHLARERKIVITEGRKAGKANKTNLSLPFPPHSLAQRSGFTTVYTVLIYHTFLCWPQVVRAKERLDEELRMQEKENVQQKQTTGESET